MSVSGNSTEAFLELIDGEGALVARSGDETENIPVDERLTRGLHFAADCTMYIQDVSELQRSPTMLQIAERSFEQLFVELPATTLAVSELYCVRVMMFCFFVAEAALGCEPYVQCPDKAGSRCRWHFVC